MTVQPGSRDQLIGVIARSRSVASITADAILKSQWLKDHDDDIRAQVLSDLAYNETKQS